MHTLLSITIFDVDMSWMQIFISSKHVADYYNFRFKQTMLTTQVKWHDNKQSQVRTRDGMLVYQFEIQWWIQQLPGRSWEKLSLRVNFPLRDLARSHARHFASLASQNGQLTRGLGKKFPPSHPSLVLPSLSAVSCRWFRNKGSPKPNLRSITSCEPSITCNTCLQLISN